MSGQRSAYSFDGDLMRVAVVALVVGLVAGAVAHLAGGSAVVWGVAAFALSTVLLGPLSGRRPARSNSSR
jgi:hypothetical protein